MMNGAKKNALLLRLTYDNLYIIKDGSDLQIDEKSELDKVDATQKSAIRTAFKNES